VFLSPIFRRAIFARAIPKRSPHDSSPSISGLAERKFAECRHHYAGRRRDGRTDRDQYADRSTGHALTLSPKHIGAELNQTLRRNTSTPCRADWRKLSARARSFFNNATPDGHTMNWLVAVKRHSRNRAAVDYSLLPPWVIYAGTALGVAILVLIAWWIRRRALRRNRFVRRSSGRWTP